MTEAADRLKHRLNTGTLGGDQDSRDVEQVIAKYEKLLADAKRGEEMYIAMTRRCATVESELATAEAALTQKTRECEELTANPPVGICVLCQATIWAKEARMTDERGMFHPICALKAQVEQLERQVAARAGATEEG